MNPLTQQRSRRNRRTGATAVLAAIATVATGPAASTAEPTPYTEQYRPQFHYTPAKNWMNDPNGLVFYQGEYHLFYQHNPSGNQWGNMSWGHAVSPDLVHWTELPVAIPQDDQEMIFSGSAVIDTNNTSGFGTRENPPMVAVYTRLDKATGVQSQALAYSTDRGRTFTKYAGNPVIDIGSRDFRDPKVFWYEQGHEWIMSVALSAERKVAFYRSSDLKSWEHLSDFGPAGATGGVWECPDLFPLPVDGDRKKTKWVLLVNINPGGIAGGSANQYFTGSFDGTRFVADDKPYVAPTGRDLGSFDDGTYGGWAPDGSAFGTAPATGNLPGQGGVSGWVGAGLANSFNNFDAGTGTLTSPEFTLDAGYLNFKVGGGKHPYVPGSTLNPSPPAGDVFADFEGSTYGTGWVATGDFAGTDPVTGTIGDQQQVTGYLGERLVNTFIDHDNSQGTITSPEFTIAKSHINLLVGGGSHPWSTSEPTSVDLVVDGKVVRSATGANNEALNWTSWDVSAYAGKKATIQIVDKNSGGWGHINVDHIMFSDEAAAPRAIDTSVRLVVDGQVVRTATGSDSETLDWNGWDVRGLQGKTARIVLADNNTGGWGHILADQFSLSDTPARSSVQRAHWVDYGKDNYAGVTFNDAPAGRRVMIGWMNNWEYSGSIPTDPWRSAMTMPRELGLRSSGSGVRLVQQPVSELQGLRQDSTLSARNLPVPTGSTRLRATGTAYELTATFAPGTAAEFGVKVRTGNGQETRIGYDRSAGELFVDRTRSGDVGFSADFPGVQRAPMAVGSTGEVTVRVLVDWSSVEVFGQDGSVAITDQIFPDPGSDGLEAFATEGTATLKSVKVTPLRSSWAD
ncbi:GH32 C-terminal domain-containing protein [Terrabacter sp. MAHUQ-38]|uniref:GH32 C-terminal domain-containing protein n=1 Tax=unclassified Terrabacter TaxID=2630222 RepID=UPI00165E162E|nr:GH32 C-terminal domain-containing protein [Terrabacter sp. MAHUQ-38]